MTACGSCDLWYQNPRPDESRIGDLYPSDYAPHNTDNLPPLTDGEWWALRHDFGYGHLSRPEKRPNAYWRWHGRWRTDDELRPRFAPNGLVVEVGSATGARLEFLREIGWQRVEGIEMSEAASEKARQRGAVVHTTSVEEGIELYGDGSIDAIVSSMVVEHLLDPFRVIERFAAKLRPGGELIFSTIVRDRLDERIWKQYWRSLDLPRHMIWFRKSDIYRMLERSFEGVRVHHQAEPIDFTGSARYRASERREWLDRLLIAIGDRALKYPVIALSFLKQTSRVVVRAVRRGA